MPSRKFTEMDSNGVRIFFIFYFRELLLLLRRDIASQFCNSHLFTLLSDVDCWYLWLKIQHSTASFNFHEHYFVSRVITGQPPEQNQQFSNRTFIRQLCLLLR